ncbi:hypothetical protein BI49514_02838 [Brevibacterium iodinum ATCC 49514]|uniref:Uncharacterized protein n=1 Tax=Brevibacterium iodinum ATCC 49514 TaxID=1255616 RepID=A0A2H1K9Q5_9MICO|nr:hypothetical protein [Brevibacterium iodinum]SMX96547.1 hypothetical protein BI49514_02838 [Brevibacterium iodinum ATCC 49514]SUW14015.1 Uncharacterised protein [Brevibacterium iodinum]
MSTNPPGRGDENEWDVNDRSGSQWSSQPGSQPGPPPSPQSGPQSGNGWGTPPPPSQSPQPQRPYIQTPHSQSGPPHRNGQPPHQQPYGYGAGPYQQAGPPAPPKKRGGLIALLVIVGIVLAGGIGWGAATFFSKDSEDPATVASTDEPTNAASDDGAAAASRSSEPTETESALPDDPKKALEQLADTDGQTAKSELNGKWVPQLSSKKVGLEAEGKTWDEEAILEEFEGLREQFPRVKLIWSGDFSSFKEDNFWVTVVGIGYDDPDDALSWCSSHGLGPESCYAKQLNTSGGHEGTTRLQD